VWDGLRGRYLAFGRSDSPLPGNSTAGCFQAYPSLRRVMLAVSNGTAEGAYSSPSQILGPGFPDDYSCLDIYNPAPIQVPGALLLLPSSYRHFSGAYSNPAPAPNETTNDGILDARLAVSRDGANFSFVSRDAFIARGVGYRDPVFGSFSAAGSDLDAGFVFVTAGGLLDTDALELASPRAPTAPFPYYVPSSRVSLLYFGTQRTHGGSAVAGGPFQGVLRATLRRDGWAAIRSPEADPVGSASFRTEPLLVPQPVAECGAPGAQIWLLLNAQTAAAGRVAVTICSPTSLAPLPGFDMPVPFTGNSVRAPAGWATSNDPAQPAAYDLSSLAGTSVVVSVELVHARLFAWEVQCVAPRP